MNIKDFKFRIYDYETNSYISNPFKALADCKESYEIELISNLKTSLEQELYDNDVIKLEYFKDNKLLDTFYAYIVYTKEREWYLSLFFKDSVVQTPIESFSVSLVLENENFDDCKIAKLDVIHNTEIIDQISKIEKRDYKEFAKAMNRFDM